MTKRDLSPAETAEVDILRLASESGKFAIEIGYPLSPEMQSALERLLMREWVTLIDVSPVSAVAPVVILTADRTIIGSRLTRVFLASNAARRWLYDAIGARPQPSDRP